MPDLTIEYMEQCKERAVSRVFHVSGYTQTWNASRGEAHCTCKAFMFSRHPKWCKHLDKAVSQLCDYHQLVDGPPKEKGVCPKCGGPTQVVRVAV